MIPHRSLGHLAAPVMICGGAYGNLEALTALLAKAENEGIPARRIIHTGDAVAYCADARTCAEQIADAGIWAIQGNVEEQLAEKGDDCACGFEEGSKCDVLARSWYAHAQDQMTPALRGWMASLPKQLSFSMSGRQVSVVHGAPSLINRFLWESLPEAEFAGELDLAMADIVIAGHTGLPFTRNLRDGRVWHNSGALGLPANDGTPRVWASIVAPDDNGPKFSHFSLDYDFTAALNKMRAVHLPAGYSDALATGIWPSADILPAAELRNTGLKLSEFQLNELARKAAA